MDAADVRHPANHEVFADLAHIVLEESWVLGVDAALNRLTFGMDFVLTADHPGHSAPRPDEMHCYRRGTLVVESDAAVLLRRSSRPPSVDPSGELDYGHLDTFGPDGVLGDPVWELTGGWGEALVRQPRVLVRLDDAPG